MLLLLAATLLVPGLSQQTAAAHMGDGVDEAAIQQAQHLGLVVGAHGGAVGAIAVEQQCLGGLNVLAPHQGDRHPDAVPADDPAPLALVGRGGGRLLLAPGAGGQIQPALVRRLGHALAADQDLLAGGIMGTLDPGRAGPFGERQAVGQLAACIQHIEPVVPGLAVLQHSVAGKQAPLLELPALA